MDLIESWGMITLAILFFIGAGGVFYHGWLSSRLAFVEFAGDTSDKKARKRIIVPLIVVFIVSAVIPWIIVYSNQDLYEEILAGKDFVKFPWKYIMPAVAMEVSIVVCALIGSLFYCGFGCLSWQIWKWVYTAKYGRD